MPSCCSTWWMTCCSSHKLEQAPRYLGADRKAPGRSVFWWPLAGRPWRVQAWRLGPPCSGPGVCFGGPWQAARGGCRLGAWGRPVAALGCVLVAPGRPPVEDAGLAPGGRIEHRGQTTHSWLAHYSWRWRCAAWRAPYRSRSCWTSQSARRAAAGWCRRAAATPSSEPRTCRPIQRPCSPPLPRPCPPPPPPPPSSGRPEQQPQPQPQREQQGEDVGRCRVVSRSDGGRASIRTRPFYRRSTAGRVAVGRPPVCLPPPPPPPPPPPRPVPTQAPSLPRPRAPLTSACPAAPRRR